MTGLAKLEFKLSTACKCREKSHKTCNAHKVWSGRAGMSEGHPLEFTAGFPHCRMASPILTGCCAPGEVLFSVSLLHALWPCCNSCPLTISSCVTTPSFACCSLNYFHSCLSPCSHHFLKMSLNAAVSPHHPSPFLLHVLLLGRTSRCINPNYPAWHLQRAEPRRPLCCTSGILGAE